MLLLLIWLMLMLLLGLGHWLGLSLGGPWCRNRLIAHCL